MIMDNDRSNVRDKVENNVQSNVANKSFTHKQLEQAYNNLEYL